MVDHFYRESNLIESQAVFESDFYSKLNTFTLSTSQVIEQHITRASLVGHF